MIRKRPMSRLKLFSAAIMTIILLGFSHQSQAAKNVILMISDGGGHNTWIAASMFQGKLGSQIYDRDGWQRMSCTTYPLNTLKIPNHDSRQNPLLVYDPLRAWDSKTDEDKPYSFPGYTFLKLTATDSAAAATAMATGGKTYNSAINWSTEDKPLQGRTIAEIAKSRGKLVGVVTSVYWSHATPAGLGGAHSRSRHNYAKIANEMLDCDWLDVIMGAGNPDFDHDAQPIADAKKRNYDCVGGKAAWDDLKQGRRDWKLVETLAEFQALATGPTPAKVLGTAQAAQTLQERRKSKLAEVEYTKVAEVSETEREERLPYSVPKNENVPTLAVMTKAALNCLDDDPDGFYLMIEGGAVDWANHANRPDRMIEEQIDFVEAVEAVADWVESHGGWENTLLILTADHETGLIWGPDSDKIAFAPLEDRGKGKLPGMKYNSHEHSNSLVPLYARGKGSRRFLKLVDGVDKEAAASWHNSGQYVDLTDVFTVMQAEIAGASLNSK